MALTNFGDINNPTGRFLIGRMLKYAEYKMLFQLFGQTAELPENVGDSVEFTRIVKFEPATTPLLEGVDPTGSVLRYERVSAQIQEYGDSCTITSKAQDLAKNPEKALASVAKIMGTQIGETLELVTYGKLIAGVNVNYDDLAHNSRSQVNTAITKSRLQGIIAQLRDAGANPITEMMESSLKQNTKPIEAAYLAVSHSDLDADIRNLDGFIPCAQYGSMKKIHDYEIGSVENIRFITSPLLKPIREAGAAVGTTGLKSTNGNIDVYPVLIFGEDWYGKIPLKGNNLPSPKVRLPGNIDSSNKLGRFGFASWLNYHTAVILNEGWGTRYEVGCTLR